MGYKAKKTEHSGAKKGCGSYRGRKADAKKESIRKRRQDSKGLIRDSTWHGSVLKEREEAYTAGKLAASDWVEAKKRIKKKIERDRCT